MPKTDTVVDLLYSGTWHDITATDDVYTRDPITITRGRPDESQRVTPSALALTLDNRDGKFSPRNPMSPLYGLIGRNTPIRVSVRAARDTFSRSVSSNWGTSDTGQLWTSFFAGGGASDFNVAAGKGTQLVSAANQFRGNYWAGASWRDVEVATTFTMSAVNITGANVEPGNIMLRMSSVSDYYLLRVEVTTAEAVVVTIHKLVANVGTMLAGPVTVPGLTWTGAPLRVKAQAVGPALRIKVWTESAGEPVAWNLTVTDRTFLTAGNVGIRSGVASGNTNVPVTFSYDDFEVRQVRFVGEVESWPQHWSVGGDDVWAPITANGITRRLNAPGTTRAEISALRRDITDSAQPTPVAYYPLEEGKDAPVPLPYNGLGEPGVINYGPAYQPGQAGPTGTLSVYGTTAKTVLGSTGPRFGRGLTLRVPSHAAGVEIVTMHVRWTPFDTPKVQDGATFADLNHRVEFTGGGIRAMRIYLQSTPSSNANVNIFFWDSTFTLLGTPDTLISTIDVDDGNWHEIQVRLVQNGAQIDTQLWADGTLAQSSTIAATTLGIMREVVLGASATYDSGLVVGQLLEGVFEASHVTVHNNNSVGQFYQATIGYVGEKAADRITRLCGQDSIPITILGTAAESEPLGEQRVAPTLELLNDAAEADGGILYEPREILGLTYRTRTDLYNQAPTATLNYAAGDEVAPPLEPVEDTDVTANDVTVTRYLGGKANVVQATGPLNVQEPSADPNGVGRYKKDATLVLATDGQCLQGAAWTKHLGTWDEARYPVVALDLTALVQAGKTALLAAAADLNIGDRVSITNPPSWVPPESIEQRAQGFTETLESHHWTITANATPALPYDVLRLETDTTSNLSRIPAGVTTLGGSLTTTGTSASFVSTKARWIDSATYGSQFPFDVVVAGERMRVTAITGTGLTQTVTVTRSINGVVKTHAAGVSVQLFRPPRIAR